MRRPQGGATDELHLVADDRPPSRRQAARRRHRERHRRRMSGVATVVALLLVIGILGGAGYGGYSILHRLTATPDYSGSGTGSVTVRVEPGDSTRMIATRLEKADVVKSAKAFRKAASENPDSLSIQPGYYKLHRHMAAALALNLILDPASKIVWRITVPEGLRMTKIFSLLAAKTHRPALVYKKAAKGKGLGLPASAKGNPEGYLFPATYDFPPRSSPKSMLRTMVRRHVAEEHKLHLKSQATRVGLTPHQVITLASLLQAEAQPRDFTKVARVIYNRVNKGIPLQFDTTVLYALGRADLHVTLKDTKVRSPYNTYLHKGLPPGPIDNPGSKAIKAALHPANGDWIYFVTTNPKTGETKFTDNVQDFKRFKKEFKKNSG